MYFMESNDTISSTNIAFNFRYVHLPVLKHPLQKKKENKSACEKLGCENSRYHNRRNEASKT